MESRELPSEVESEEPKKSIRKLGKILLKQKTYEQFLNSKNESVLELVELVLAAREERNRLSGEGVEKVNYAAVRFENKSGEIIKSKAYNSGSKKGVAGHSERVALVDAIDQAIEAGWFKKKKKTESYATKIGHHKEDLSKIKVTVFTERECCTHHHHNNPCSILLRENLGADSKIYFVVDYGPEGKRNQDLVADELRNELNKAAKIFKDPERKKPKKKKSSKKKEEKEEEKAEEIKGQKEEEKEKQYDDTEIKQALLRENFIEKVSNPVLSIIFSKYQEALRKRMPFEALENQIFLYVKDPKVIKAYEDEKKMEIELEKESLLETLESKSEEKKSESKKLEPTPEKRKKEITTAFEQVKKKKEEEVSLKPSKKKEGTPKLGQKKTEG